MRKLAIVLIKIYQIFISPMLGSNCRFSPSCSEYAKECFSRFGFFKAFKLTSKRISKCHPYHDGGYDPVPTEKEHE